MQTYVGTDMTGPYCFFYMQTCNKAIKLFCLLQLFVPHRHRECRLLINEVRFLKLLSTVCAVEGKRAQGADVFDKGNQKKVGSATSSSKYMASFESPLFHLLHRVKRSMQHAHAIFLSILR